MSYHKQLKILIIEQSDTDRAFYTALLEQDKTCLYTFEYAACGGEGLQRSIEVQPDCILLNFQLPDMDGVAFLCHLLNSTGATVFPVLVLSEGLIETAAFQSIQHGAQDYFLKDKLTAENLRRVVHYSVERHEINRKLHQAYTQVNNILESIMEGFIALDRKWQITYINRHAETMLRQKRQDLLGRNILECLPELVDSNLAMSFQDFVRSDATSQHLQTFFAPFESWFEIQAYKASNNEVTIYFRDITARKHTEELLKNRERYQLAIVELARQALVTHSFNEVCTYAVEVITKVTRCEQVLIFEHSPTNNVFKLPLTGTTEPTGSEVILSADANYQPGYTFHTTEPIYNNEVENPGLFDPLPFLPDADSVFNTLLTMVIPGGHSKQPYGVLGIYSRETRPYNRDELHFLEGVANLLGLVHERIAVVDIQKALEQEREVSELKSQFISMTSHEFRTPLSVILSSAELLERYYPKLSPESKLAHFQRIRSSVKHMTEMLNNVLVIGKAEAGKLEFNPQMLDLIEFCRQVVDELSSTSASRRLFFEVGVEVAPALADKNLMRHTLVNLISNSLKYSPADSQVILRLDYFPQDKAVFSVKDKGIGILAEEMPLLFEVFQRGSNAGNIPGTGLGLAIVKRSIDLQGGTIEVKSVISEGTVFTVSIPVKGA
jgi:PAS domain S-box-containing protein